VSVGPVLFALSGAATAWAFLLALSAQAPGIGAAVGDPPPERGGAMPLARALRLARLALLGAAGVALGLATAWWTRNGPTQVLMLVAGVALLLFMGDIVPRALGGLVPSLARSALRAARASLLPFRPLLGILGWIDTRTHRLVPSAAPAPRREFGVAQRDMLLGVLSLEDTTVEDIMTPRLDVVGVDAEASWGEVVEVARRSEHSRLPVFRETLDDVAGIVFAKDLAPGLIGTTAPPERWQELIRPVSVVPESKTLAQQLRDFQRGGGHLAIVVDEFGGTSGLVTLEDVLEEIVGEIRDEYDVQEEPEIEREGNDRFWVNGRVTLDDLSATLGARFEHEEVSTVGGLVYAELGRVPRPGEELTIGGFRVVVENVVRRRIHRVYFERLAGAELSTRDASGTWEEGA
jgi:putative hemolysin